ncbi:hypothetical protein GCM10027048_00950 [Hymenobacter coalescens]
MRHSFFFDPTKSGLFYLALFLLLVGLGLSWMGDVGNHYSVVGSVASFLAFFVAFQSWRAANEASRNTDEALQQMHQVAEETRKLAESNMAIDQQIRGAVNTISDATRELYKGMPRILSEVREFLDRAHGSEYLAVLTDSAAIGKFWTEHYAPGPQRQLASVTDRIHTLLLERARDAREFYLATLAAEETTPDFPPAEAGNSLYGHFLRPLWQQLHPERELSAAAWEAHRHLHHTTLRQVQETFELFADHPEQRQAGLGSHFVVPTLPLQLLIRVDMEAAEPFRALVIFVGQYNLGRLAEARAMLTADPELVRSFVSMFESLVGLDGHPGYQQLRRQWPL